MRLAEEHCPLTFHREIKRSLPTQVTTGGWRSGRGQDCVASNTRPLQKPELNAKEMRMVLNWRLQQQAKEEQRVNVATTGNNQNITKT